MKLHPFPCVQWTKTSFPQVQLHWWSPEWVPRPPPLKTKTFYVSILLNTESLTMNEWMNEKCVHRLKLSNDFRSHWHCAFVPNILLYTVLASNISCTLKLNWLPQRIILQTMYGDYIMSPEKNYSYKYYTLLSLATVFLFCCCCCF